MTGSICSAAAADATAAEQWTETGQLQLNATQPGQASRWKSFNDPVLDKLIEPLVADGSCARAKTSFPSPPKKR